MRSSMSFGSVVAVGTNSFNWLKVTKPFRCPISIAPRMIFAKPGSSRGRPHFLRKRPSTAGAVLSPRSVRKGGELDSRER